MQANLRRQSSTSNNFASLFQSFRVTRLHAAPSTENDANTSAKPSTDGDLTPASAGGDGSPAVDHTVWDTVAAATPDVEPPLPIDKGSDAALPPPGAVSRSTSIPAELEEYDADRIVESDTEMDGHTSEAVGDAGSRQKPRGQRSSRRRGHASDRSEDAEGDTSLSGDGSASSGSGSGSGSDADFAPRRRRARAGTGHGTGKSGSRRGRAHKPSSCPRRGKPATPKDVRIIDRALRRFGAVPLAVARELRAQHEVNTPQLTTPRKGNPGRDANTTQASSASRRLMDASSSTTKHRDSPASAAASASPSLRPSSLPPPLGAVLKAGSHSCEEFGWGIIPTFSALSGASAKLKRPDDEVTALAATILGEALHAVKRSNDPLHTSCDVAGYALPATHLVKAVVCLWSVHRAVGEFAGVPPEKAQALTGAAADKVACLP